MTKSLVSGLLAAAAMIVPGLASAQDRSVADVFRGRAQAKIEQRGGWQRPTDAQDRIDARAQRPQFEQRGDRGTGWQRPERATPPAAAQADAGVRIDRGQRGDRGQWSGDRGQWRGNPDGRRDGGRPLGVFNGEAQARAAAEAQARAGRDRGDRYGSGRDRSDARRWDGNRGQAYNRGGWDRGRADWHDNARQAYRFDDRRSWNRGWRTDNRYDWNRYRAQNRYAYHLPRYYAPSGWNYGYRRFSIGATLSSSLWGQNYWIDNPYAYRLPEIYGPYRWVRYYNDALLVDTYTGQVVDVINDIFW